MLKLFYSPGSCATASHIALEEAGADYELELVKLGEQQQTVHAWNADLIDG